MQRLTFYVLRSRYGGNLLQIASVAQVHTNIVLAMVLNLGVTEASALKIISAFNLLNGTNFTLGDVDILISQEEYFLKNSRIPGAICF